MKFDIEVADSLDSHISMHKHEDYPSRMFLQL